MGLECLTTFRPFSTDSDVGRIGSMSFKKQNVVPKKLAGSCRDGGDAE